MNFGRERQNEPEINLTPLIDVVFLMLIFFMVSTTFSREGELEITLPEASVVANETQAEGVELVVNHSGRYFIGEDELVDERVATIRRVLARQGDWREGRPLVITADANAPYQAVVRALDAAGQLGIQAISLTTKSAPGDQ